MMMKGNGGGNIKIFINIKIYDVLKFYIETVLVKN